MVRDAQSQSQEDRKRREAIEARNNADLMAYQVEREIKDLGDKIPIDEKARAEQLISKIRELIRDQSTDVALLCQLSDNLQQVGYGLFSAAYSQSTAAGAQSGGQIATQQGGDDEVMVADLK